MNGSVCERDVVIKNEAGLHARPASAIILAVASSDCDVEILNPENGRTADAKSTTELLMLGAAAGTRLHIKVSGDGSARLLETIAGLFESGFGEE